MCSRLDSPSSRIELVVVKTLLLSTTISSPVCVVIGGVVVVGVGVVVVIVGVVVTVTVEVVGDVTANVGVVVGVIVVVTVTFWVTVGAVQAASIRIPIAKNDNKSRFI